ncbi:Asp-tRNA(Asn)/Glu-tRNA(Gln) amidotransferase subunit GatC [Sneathiella sp. CAU 1612]|jgi:aspartyl-tRNA(Asn)/glutamyl-tRNA(Gln) amidotransferase subunit C|uniref:Aspartyl/glutamyl-tRNA(Asn/Gln) amidotransferase subunit C n=1 Tax=Sneathiella sedimenti TaxID=2816034 RepID=A0ABS3F771_9PROT|nr:Asp-tRNA(Asn)/Glu-tRNA(Gln) amidotransferase subunit GatC [Sneathiella sedimenti]MBO0334380.1 Asp-tRNA(Asn)/Glu-tRNA(Gln) amidotransferase subunit GatC [Sneathiella sedimenti]
MSLDKATVAKVANLARIKIEEKDLEPMAAELNNILGWVEQLGEVDTDNVEPMTSVAEMRLRWRADEVTDGGYVEDVVANAPGGEDGYFAVPKVIE